MRASPHWATPRRLADLLTAVLASEHRLTLIHYEGDFDTRR